MKPVNEEVEKLLCEKDFEKASVQELTVALVDSLYPKLAGKFLVAEIIRSLNEIKGYAHWNASADEVAQIHKDLIDKGWYHKVRLTISLKNQHYLLSYLVKIPMYKAIIEQIPTRIRRASQSYNSSVAFETEKKVFLYLNDPRAVDDPFFSNTQYYTNNPPDEFFRSLDRKIQRVFVKTILERAFNNPIQNEYYKNLALYMDFALEKGILHGSFLMYYALISCDFEKYDTYVSAISDEPLYHNYYTILRSFFTIRSAEEALVLAKKLKLCIRDFRRELENNKAVLGFPEDLIYIFVLIKAYSLVDAKDAILKDYQNYVKLLDIDGNLINVFNDFFRSNNYVTSKEIMLRLQKDDESDNLKGFELLIYAVALYNMQREKKRDTWLFELLQRKFRELKEYNIFLSTVFAQLNLALIPYIETSVSDEEKEEYISYTTNHPCFDFVGLNARALSWQARIDAIHNFITTSKDTQDAKKKVSNNPKRLVWFVNFSFREITPYEQSFSKETWTKGRKVSAAKLKNNMEEYTYLTSQDKNIIKNCIKKDYWADLHTVDYDKGLLELVDHPLIFDEQSSENIEFEHKDAELQIEVIKQEKKTKKDIAQEDMYKLKFVLPKNSACTATECIRRNTYSVMSISAEHLRLQELMGEEELIVPQSVHAKVLDLVSYEGSPVKVNMISDLKEIKGNKVNAKPIFRLKQYTGQGGNALNIQAIVYPMEGSTNCFTPTKGNDHFVARVNDEAIKIVRSFEKEEEELHILFDKAPILKNNLENAEYVWDFEEGEDAYQALLELQNAQASVEWFSEPKQVTKSTSSTSMRVGVKSKNNWFSIHGKVQVDENLVLDMHALLKKVKKYTGRFIPLDNGQILALTEDFRRTLERISKLSQEDKDEDLVHPLALPALDSLFEGIGEFKDETVQSSLKWKEWKKKFENLEEEIALPKGLQAELRSYQIEGYNWLAGLVRLGSGACLADDMGLGKTLQTIALMLHLRQISTKEEDQKPMLIIAPTSVCHNWELEFQKFAPSLEIQRLTAMDSKKQRKKVIEELSSNQVLIMGYSLLHTEIEVLEKSTFKLVVFDEAQALKNAMTMRSQSSRRLNASTKVALTGTPIENSLDDLWSIFNIINPALLGSHESFRQRFDPPATGPSRNSARQALKSLVNPFILRRTKNKVLEELPSRTEQTLIIEPSAEELAFYEALRRQALENIEKAREKAKEENKKASQFLVLAELTKLRRAACNATLIDPSSSIESSKLKTLINLVQDLRKNNHQALIFSQFTSHLKIVYEEIQKLGINAFYLDGSTPEKKRAELVNAFQNGQADLFCISLKAGGQGLNLTAADYVLHLDPWWNPAVEDQASDRAYRIGQTRPVTIYRLIMQGSVEEKILDLHSTKRELAEDILAETDSASRLSLDDLMNLLS